MGTKSVEKAVSNDVDMFNEVCGILAIAQLMQKASERIDDSTPGLYGTAFIIEEKAQRLLSMMGQGLSEVTE